MLILAYSGFRFVYGTKATAAASTCICECVRAPMCWLCVCVRMCAQSEPYGQLVQPCDNALVYS